MKVFQIAKELGVTSKEVLAKLHEMGVEAKNQVAMVDDIMLAVLRGEAPPPPKPDPAAKAAAAKAAAAKVDAKGAKGAKPAKAPAKPAPAAAPAVAAPAATPAAPTASPKSKAKAKAKAKESPAEPAAAPTPTPELDTVSGSLPLAEVVDGNVLRLRGPIIVKNLAEVLSLKPNIIIAELMKMNILAAINQSIDVQIIRKIAEKHGFTVQIEKRGRRPSIESKLEERPEDEDQPEDLMPRPPVVTFLGHVDHGKTSLLDQIRNAKVAAGESGGITQHIGAYTVELSGKKIAFLDTPGHAAFTAMRARGANLTDVAVIIIAADDGIMPQTREAIKHVQAAGVAMMVAINKIDMPTADVQRVLQQLQAEGLAPEEWGGDLICCPVSAETGDGIDHLLEMILLQADVLELKANPTRRAEGYVIEAQLEPGMGPTANMLIKRGTLSVGDVILCGQYSGKVRALINDHGAKVKSAGPSTPIKCLGLPGVPGAGDRFQVFANDKAARTLASEEATKLRHESLYTPVKTSLDSLFTEMAEGEKMELKVVLKADTQGSVEAIATSLEDIQSDKVILNIILSSTGNVTDNDVMLASASNAIILAFHVGKESGVDSTAKHEGVEVRLHQVIYELIDEVRDAMTGLLKPLIHEDVRGEAEIRKAFVVGRRTKVAGCLVTKGNIRPSYRARVLRGDEVLSEGRIESLKHFQDEVAEVREAQECGIRLDKSMDYVEGDRLQFYELTEVAQTL
ncbi:MAG: translation initiation factor IF-2 [Verrucomicrobia bacterium]|jgi:translation initiation factor IF-2|nr:translation initiation factor IF-2 [Verrucomicrobiota bacterium]MBT7065377.1 translation initiation factor IF-2 [Verrucomicrobiota bacterium]MBT7701317.1 translation initiation factor IF-2 [Verrucomicrobiota bacterium]